MADIFGSLAPSDDPILPQPRNPAMPADFAQEAVRKVLGGLANLVMAPKRAMDQGMTTADSTDWAGEMAMTLAGAGAPAAVRGAAGIFGGKLAQTADRAALAKAEEMAASGAPREQIWNDTGWFKGGDDKWRFEIPDRTAQAKEFMPGNFSANQALSHLNLYRAYPDTKGVLVGLRHPDTMGGLKGKYTPPESRGGSGVWDTREEVQSQATIPSDVTETLLHEFQHAVQRREGFASGGMPQNFGKEQKELFDNAWTVRNRMDNLGESPEVAAKYIADSSGHDPKALQQLAEQFTGTELRQKMKGADPFEQYRRLAGEVEARNVQTRMNMTPEERRAKPPWMTEDVPTNQQIFGSLAPSGGAQMSLPVDAPGAIGAAGGKLMQPGGIRAYHSSPHDFERFDLSKIGTGEGAQSYGHGLYAAENPAVSGQGGQYWDQFLNRFSGPELDAAKILRNNKFDRTAAVSEGEGLVQHYDDKHSRDVLRLLESDKPVGPRTYELNINAKPEQFLDWDRPLAATGEVRQLNPKMKDIFDSVKSDWFTPEEFQALRPERQQKFLNETSTGQYVYNKIASRGGGHPYATDMLREAGIPGIKYLDQGSRKVVDLQKIIDQSISPDRVRLAKQELEQLNPSSNYVVFDDKLIDIMRKYGLAGAAAPTAAGASFGSLAPSEQ